LQKTVAKPKISSSVTNKRQELSFSPLTKIYLRSLELASYSFLLSTSFHSIESFMPIFSQIVIHTSHKEYQLSSQDRAPSLKLAHQGHSTITCKTTNQTKNKKTIN